MKLIVRETTEADLPAIVRIQNDPLVTLQQFRAGKGGTLAAWRQRLHGDWRRWNVSFRCSTIDIEGEIAGYITQLTWQARSLKQCYCGWNLDPPRWGQGLAVQALTLLFNSLFAGTSDLDAVISDCFTRNDRCLRVLAKLGYQPAPIPWFERLHTALRFGCHQWILRHRLDGETGAIDSWHRRKLRIDHLRPGVQADYSRHGLVWIALANTICASGYGLDELVDRPVRPVVQLPPPSSSHGFRFLRIDGAGWRTSSSSMTR
jgi:RimJ/RimL family protein N-acetyltransferase